MRTRAGEAGFSILDVLIAVAILGVALVPLLQLQGLSAREAGRQAALREEARATRNALAILREINPAREPVGRRALGGDEIMTWRARPLAAWRGAIGQSVADSAFEAALFELDVDIRDARGRTIARFTTETPGWRERGR